MRRPRHRRSLGAELEQLEQKRFHDWGWKLFHAWPAAEWQCRPRLPDYVHAADAPPAEVDALMSTELPSEDKP